MKQVKASLSPILDFLNQPGIRYLSDSGEVVVEKLQPDYGKNGQADADIIFFRVDEMTFEEEAPRREALENVLSAVRIPGINFLYLLVGSETGVKFYYGLSKDPSSNTNDLNMPEIGESILGASLKGNFRGCQVEMIETEEKDYLLQKIRKNMKYAARLEGVPGTIKDNEKFQSVDRLVNVMRGSSFCLLIVAQSVQQNEVAEIEDGLNRAYSQLSTDVKWSTQIGESTGTSKSESSTTGTNESDTKSKSHTEGDASSTSLAESKSRQRGNSTQEGKKSVSDSGSEGTNKGHSDSKNKSDQEGSSHTGGKSESKTVQDGTNTNKSSVEVREHLNKCAQEWLKYCDDVLFPRLDYSRGKGLFRFSFYVMAKNRETEIKLENTALSLYSGAQGNRVPMKAIPIGSENPLRKSMEHCCIPVGRFQDGCSETERLGRSLLSQEVSERSFLLGNWISTNELAMIAGLPQKEVVGMRLRELVEFGLNYDQPLKEDCIEIGHLIQDGKELKHCPVFLDRTVLDRHLFITGVTGSGKTTTCQRILLQSNLPFMVIEPAKTEYRELKKREGCEDLLVFTLGNNDVAPFRLNPLEFMRNEGIVSHVDMIKASMFAAFEMEAAIPQLIEAAIYRCYEDRGWDIRTNKNKYHDDPFAPGCNAFPTLSDLLVAIPRVVDEQGFDERLKNDYIGSIRARLQSLTLGGKGMMLDTERSVDIDKLLDKKVVIELEYIRNGNEKALIMGFILAAFHEAVRERYLIRKKPHCHILLVEEAHRLLTKCVPGDNANKKLGVEFFADMLAEIRKYGESLIVVDQIPNKLEPDVLKNTNTKIVHRIFAKDDKEIIGDTIALNDEQKQYLSSLETGEAVMFSDHFGKALLVKVKEQEALTQDSVRDSELTQEAIQYYLDNKLVCPISKNYMALSSEDQELVKKILFFDIPKEILYSSKKSKSKKSNRNSEYESLLKSALDKGILELDSLVHYLLDRVLQNRDPDFYERALIAFTRYFRACLYNDESVSRTGIQGYV